MPKPAPLVTASFSPPLMLIGLVSKRAEFVMLNTSHEKRSAWFSCVFSLLSLHLNY